MEVGWDSLPWLPAATESRSPRGSRLYVSSAVPSPPWLRGVRTRPRRQVRLRLRSTLFATHSAPLQPRPVTFRSPTFFERRARSKVRVFGVFFVCFFSFLFFWRPGEGREPARVETSGARHSRRDRLNSGAERPRREGRFDLVFVFSFFFPLKRNEPNLETGWRGRSVWIFFSPAILRLFVCFFSGWGWEES